MAFVPNFEHDVFVSYAHVDDEVFPGRSIGWVSELVQFLKLRLNQKLGRADAYSLWIDRELGAYAPISEQLMGTIAKTAVLLVILSPGYVASEWCRRERNGFLRLVRAGGATRVMVVEREPIEDSQWPDELKDLKLFRFWMAQETKPRRILGYPKPDDDNEYYSRMEDLCADLADMLKRMRTSGEPAQVSPQSGPLVYLARTTYDLDHEWNDVKRYLDQAGIRVLPETSYPLEADTFRASAERDIRQCKLVVQLLSMVPLRKPATSPTDFATIQLDLAKQLGKPVLQWRHPELDPDIVRDELQKKLLEGSNVRAESLEDFKQEVRKRAFAKTVVPPPVRAFVFVDVDVQDGPLADAVCASLDQFGAEWVLPRAMSCKGRELDPEAVRSDLEYNLRDCDALIIVYGNSDVDWVRNQLRLSRKTLASRERPLNALAVFEGPPADKQPLGRRLHGKRVVDCRNGFNETELLRFLEVVRAEDK